MPLERGLEIARTLPQSWLVYQGRVVKQTLSDSALHSTLAPRMHARFRCVEDALAKEGVRRRRGRKEYCC